MDGTLKHMRSKEEFLGLYVVPIRMVNHSSAALEKPFRFTPIGLCFSFVPRHSSGAEGRCSAG